MEDLRTQIFDHLYRSGPQNIEQIAGSLGLDRETITAAVEHEWFETFDAEVRIAVGKTPNSSQGSIG